MKLLRLRISRNKWETDEPLAGDIEFETPQGKIELNLTDEDVAEILKYCASAIVEASKRVADSLTAEIINANLLEHEVVEVPGYDDEGDVEVVEP